MAEAFQGSEKLVFNLGAGCRKIHQPSARVTVEGPESCDREDRGCLPGEIRTSGRGLLAGLVIEENMTLPIRRAECRGSTRQRAKWEF
jgi:hypothetical protein